ncbi:related to 3-ketoacyl-acyl carrier protein reductase [Rhynchosporium graminicola]|uniref:Related to 3-ketoacyl-acyl carrier protein reductase n=1 Tax=Rhynchosporium graminicola TaxID=2792576 RepID=A0A1E1KKN2_9HELO|nr:related to 3-ketoacyl-acyl carrier protein reductase [Rhynchosporium commune]
MPFNYHDGTNILPQRTIDVIGFGKVAIITGCASGVGLATIQLFLSHQYEVLGVDIVDMEYAKIDQRDQERFHFHRGDLTEDGECDEVVRICVAKFGRLSGSIVLAMRDCSDIKSPKIDVLANVAGVMDAFEAIDVFSDAEWSRIMSVNLTVPTRMIRAVIPFMKAKQNGSIINVASKAAISGATAGLAYTTSKHGLLGVTKHTAWRFRDEGIRCNAVLPGTMETNVKAFEKNDHFDEAGFAALRPIWELHNPVGETPSITSNEVANVILFLASDGARAINGVALPIDKAWGVI